MSLSQGEVQGQMEVYHLVCDDPGGDDTRMRLMFGDAEVAARVWLASFPAGVGAPIEEDSTRRAALRYELVAKLKGCDPEDAFRLTNTIDRLWTRNSEVEVVGSPKKRSTSVGDVVVVRASADSAPVPMVVAAMGFEPLPLPAAQVMEMRGVVDGNDDDTAG